MKFYKIKTKRTVRHIFNCFNKTWSTSPTDNVNCDAQGFGSSKNTGFGSETITLKNRLKIYGKFS